MRHWIERLRLNGFFLSERWGPFSFRDAFGIALIAVLLVVLGISAVYGPATREKLNHGFGNEWECNHPGRGGPICHKYITDQPVPSLTN